MTPVSIVKVIASASVLVAAGTAAFVVGADHLQHEQKLTVGTVSATVSPPQGAPAVRRDAQTVANGTSANETSAAPAATPAPAAPVATQANASDVAADLAGPPGAAGKDHAAPSFDIVRVEEDGEAVIAGRAAPGATVDLLRGGERLAQAVADSSGEFVMVPPRLPAGSYELTLSAKSPDGTAMSSEHGAAVTVADAPANARAAQSRAEYIPETASQPHAPTEPRLRTGKLEDSGDPRPAHARHAGLAPDDGASSRPVGHAFSSKVVSRGDSLWRISRIIYGDGSRYALVYRANRERIRTPNLIYPGQTLVLPPRHN